MEGDEEKQITLLHNGYRIPLKIKIDYEYIIKAVKNALYFTDEDMKQIYINFIDDDECESILDEDNMEDAFYANANVWSTSRKELDFQILKEDDNNRNNQLTKENNDLKEEINKLNIKIDLLEKDLTKKNNEIQQLLSQSNNIKDKYKITFINPGEEIMTVNFVTTNNNDIMNYSLACKNTDLFIRLEERLYEDFPQYKEYQTYFEVNTRRIKRFKTLEQNNIKNNDIVSIFIIETDND